jgi:hypothetical protein
MKQTVDFNTFAQAFVLMGRREQFSYSGLRALFDYLEEYEQDTGTEIELDVIGLCCDYVELDEQEAREQYSIPDDEEWQEFLRNETTVIDVDSDRVIIQQY